MTREFSRIERMMVMAMMLRVVDVVDMSGVCDKTRVVLSEIIT